jgi:integrase
VRKHGAYHYRVPAGLEPRWGGKRWFRLGATLPEAYKKWAERIGDSDKARTIGELLDRYAMEVVPTKAPKTRAENVRHIERLRAVFGAMPLEPFKPRLVYTYVDMRGAKVAAHREIEVLSHAFTKAVEWGYIDRHPFKGEVRLEGEPPRTRYVEDWEVVEALALAPRRKRGSVLAVQAYIRLKLLTGMARSDLLRLRLGEHLREDGIHVTRHKTASTAGKRTIYDYVLAPERLDAVKRALAVRPELSPFLFCNRRGESYFNEETGTCNGWDSMWQRFMDRLLTETNVKQRFSEHDLRAKVASDAASLEKARALLQHADARTTARASGESPNWSKPCDGSEAVARLNETPRRE